jgi:S1-C subfamily serine protease
MRGVAVMCGARVVVALGLVIAPARGPQIVQVRVGEDAATGFVVGDGRVVTVAHVLNGREVVVDGRPATVLRRDERLDLAALSVPGIEGGGVEIARDDQRVVRRADASLDGSGWRRPVLELRTDVEPGDSGAPVLTSSGQVVGVVFARSERPGRAWAIDASDPAVVEFVRLSRTNSTLRARGTRR